MLDAAFLIPALPLAGFLVLVFAGRRLGDPLAGWVATLAGAGAFAASIVTFLGLLARDAHDRRFTQELFTWIEVGSLDIGAALLVDPLSMAMALFVTGVGTLIHLYSVGYMRGDPDYPRFFVYLNLFLFSMLVLVLGDNFVLTFLGWEGVGACSYLLISFWFERNVAAVAGKKAFVTNRIGDVGFMLAMFLLFTNVGSLRFVDVMAAVDTLPEVTATAIALLLFVGACGKSAQLPLYVWLPDAMEGPTPVSALIHAATMVTAGVYLMVRTAPLLFEAPAALTTIAIVGAATALFAATIACAQDDIKKVLAYSTISQLGYMFLAVGSGAYVAAMFHMITHAFFKALLFLGAGSVIHGLHDEQDMKRMGGLRRWMPLTWATFLVGWLAISGFPGLSGFWSKDEVLLGAWGKSQVLWGVGVVTALLTAYYMSRQVFLVFYGKERWRHPADVAPESATGHDGGEEELTQPEPVGASVAAAAHRAEAAAPGDAAAHAVHDEHGDAAAHGGANPHESPWTMALPLVVLAVLAAAGGALNLPFEGLHFLDEWLEPVFGEHVLVHTDATSSTKFWLGAAAGAAGIAGILIAAATWLRRGADTRGLEPMVLRKAWGVDALYSAVVGGPGRLAAAWTAFVVDKRIVDGAVNGIALVVRAGGSQLRRVQTGYVRNYALGLAAGAVLVLAWVITRVGM